MSCQINKNTTKKALESYRGEILETLEKDQTKFFLSAETDSFICAKFQVVSLEHAKFRKYQARKRMGFVKRLLSRGCIY